MLPVKAPKYSYFLKFKSPWFYFIIAFIWIPKQLQLVFEMWVHTRSKALLLLASLVKFARSSLTVCVVLVGWFAAIQSFSRVMFHCGFPALHFRGLQLGHQRELKILQSKLRRRSRS